MYLTAALAIWFSNILPSENKSVLKFNNEVESTSDIVMLAGNGTFEADSITVCFRLYAEFYKPITLFDADGQALKLDLVRNYGSILLNNTGYAFDLSDLTLGPRAWHHLCYLYQGNQNPPQLMVVVNGISVLNKTVPKTTIKFSNQLGIGNQLQGMVTYFNIWQQPLSSHEVIQFTRNCDDLSTTRNSRFLLSFKYILCTPLILFDTSQECG